MASIRVEFEITVSASGRQNSEEVKGSMATVVLMLLLCTNWEC